MAPDPLRALGHAVGVVRIVIGFRARTKAKTAMPASKDHRLIYQSLDCLATHAPDLSPIRGEKVAHAAATGI
jgi:hypothetical protein